jgi:lysyl-tRNA synthetase class I
MDAQLRSMLNETEQALLRAVQSRELKRLDEDELAELHDRVRRARNKYSKLYRRRSSERVTSDRSRGRASAANATAARKAEGFEDALAKVSERLAQVAAAAAEELKAERLAAARRTPVAPTTPTTKKATGGPATGKSTTRTPASEKKRASTKSSNKRSQAARDHRS